jgi:hypothetical protein
MVNQNGIGVPSIMEGTFTPKCAIISYNKLVLYVYLVKERSENIILRILSSMYG